MACSRRALLDKYYGCRSQGRIVAEDVVMLGCLVVSCLNKAAPGREN